MKRAWKAVRRVLVDRVRDLDDGLHAGASRRRRVLFEARTPVNFVCLKPVHDRLAADPRIECWYTATLGDAPAERIFHPLGITRRIVPWRRAEWMKFDLYMNSDFAVMARLRRRARQVHFFHGVAGKYDLDGTHDPTRSMEHFESLGWFDRIAFINSDRLRKWYETGLLAQGDPRPALVGYPKLDGLVNGTFQREAILARLRLDPSRPVLLYAPTYSAASSLHVFGEAVIDALRASGHQVIVKLHDRAYDPRERYSAGVDWAARLARYAPMRDVVVVTEPDATPFLAAADVMVSDHSSVAFEFLLADRPLLIFDLPGLLAHARVHADQARWIREAGEAVVSPDRLPRAVARALENPGARAAARREVAARLFYRPGEATERATALCYELLGLPLPDRTAAPGRAPSAVRHAAGLGAPLGAGLGVDGERGARP